MSRFATALAALALAAPAAAQIDVAIVAAATSDSTNCRFTDPQAKLLATGQFSSVDIINANQITPTLADLQAYDAVITWTNLAYADAVAFGDVLADYVDGGGGVVVAVFATANPAIDIEGRWKLGGYEVIFPTNQQQGTQVFLGTVHQPSHPVMSGVTSFDGGPQSYRPVAPSLALGAIPVADWSDGIPLVVQGMNPLRVDLGFYPPSSDCNSGFWSSSTDGTAMMANALTFVAGGSTGTIGTNYCGPAVMNSSGQPAAMSAAGSTSVAANDVTLTCSGMPANQFGYFLNSMTQASTFPVPNSQGTLCVGGAIGRYNGQIQNSGAGGEISIVLDLPNTPTPSGAVAVLPNESWNFTCWYRDNNPGPTSNFSDGLTIAFQ